MPNQSFHCNIWKKMSSFSCCSTWGLIVLRTHYWVWDDTKWENWIKLWLSGREETIHPASPAATKDSPHPRKGLKISLIPLASPQRDVKALCLKGFLQKSDPLFEEELKRSKYIVMKTLLLASPAAVWGRGENSVSPLISSLVCTQQKQPL